MKTDVYVGIDIGATTSRLVALDADGGLLVARLGSGANPTVERAPGAVEAVLTDQLGGLQAAAPNAVVRGVVIGLAGSLAWRAVREECDRAARRVGLNHSPLVVNDAEAMFASGSAEANGSVLAAGTGAIGLAIRDGAIARRFDGHGWLVGDEGSAVWIALHGVRAVLAALEGRGQPTTMVGDVAQRLAELAGEPALAEAAEIAAAARRLGPPAVAGLAAIVDRHAEGGDLAARAILASAADALGRTLGAVVGERGEMPIVLGGGVVARSATVRQALLGLAAANWPAARLRVVEHGAVGAALWARRTAGLDHDDRLVRALARRAETSAIDQMS